VNPVLDMTEPDVLERQLYRGLRGVVSMSRKRNRDALIRGMEALEAHERAIRGEAERTLLHLEEEDEIGIVLLARPYHNDPGINHGIPAELNRRGYPIFTVDSLPQEGALVSRILGSGGRHGSTNPMRIDDVWERCFSENSSTKIWAARVTALHPNLIGLDLSSFRCGHDAMIYAALDDLFSKQNKPYFTFHEIDENKPLGSIRLRVETIDYFLRDYQKEIQNTRGTLRGIAGGSAGRRTGCRHSSLAG
jgi:predicted nucleotide-binding protein (sugar kinase/HSP70/actin superfamily)